MKQPHLEIHAAEIYRLFLEGRIVGIDSIATMALDRFFEEIRETRAGRSILKEWQDRASVRNS